jgi:hypothetical protein
LNALVFDPLVLWSPGGFITQDGLIPEIAFTV